MFLWSNKKNIRTFLLKKKKNVSSGAMPVIQDPVVHSIISLMSSLVVKMLTVLVSTIPNSQVFLLKKCE